MNDNLIHITICISASFSLPYRLISIVIIVIGAVFCVIRILFCVCPSHCISRRERNKKNAKVDADHRTSLLGDTKRVSIARGPYINVRFAMRIFFNVKLETFIKR